MPIGRNPDTDLMLTPAQREDLKRVTKRLRRKGLLVISPEDLFEKDEGCIAGTGYASVTASGKLQPCVFVHASDTNVYDGGSLTQALLQSPLIRTCQSAQADGRSCLVRDRPEVLEKIMAETGAKSTEQ